MAELRGQLENTEDLTTAAENATLKVLEETSQEKERLENIHAETQVVQSHSAPYISIIEERKKSVHEVEEMERYNNSAPEERQTEVKELYSAREALQREIPSLELEKKEARGNLGEAKIKHDECKPAFDSLKLAESDAKKMAELEIEISKIEKEVAELRGESKRLQDEIEKAPGGCCSVM